MKKNFKRGLMVLVVVVAGSIALNILAYRHAYAMMHFNTGTARTIQP